MSDGEFYVCTTGSIEYGKFYEIDNVYCKYGYHFGSDWTVVAVRTKKKLSKKREIEWFIIFLFF